MYIVLGVVVFVLVAVLAVYITKYRTVGPDEGLIVTGSYLGTKNVHTDDSGNRMQKYRIEAKHKQMLEKAIYG